MNDASHHTVGATQHLGCFVEVSFSQDSANTGRADSRRFVKEHRLHKDFKGERFAHRFERFHASLAIAPKAEVFSYGHPESMKPIDQHVFDKIFCREASERMTERENVDAFNPGGENTQHFVVERRDTRHLNTSAKEIFGVGLKRDNRGHEATIMGCLADHAQKTLMSKVHAVKVANSNRRRTL